MAGAICRKCGIALHLMEKRIRKKKLTMGSAKTPLHWLPLFVVLCLAVSFEPIRSRFEFANQSCEFVPTVSQLIASFSNLKHVIGYGLICLTALLAMPGKPIWHIAIGVLVFSASMEVFQSFFVTGHCRAWDLIPNVIGIVLAIVLFKTGGVLSKRQQ